MGIFFFFFYSLVMFFLYLLALPFLLLLIGKQKYRYSIPARFFFWHNRPLKGEGIWFHSCSFGEAKAIAPLVSQLPQALLRMSSTTQTGFGVIKEYTEQSRYLPFDPLLFFWIRRQRVLVVMEAEFWYLLFTLARKRGAKTLLINARMSDRSFPKYQKFAWFYRQIFASIDHVYAQTALDKARLEALGAKRVSVTGNIKLSQLPLPAKQLPKPGNLLLCAASTHEGEEGLILEAFSAFKKERRDAQLLVAPRHPERFNQVAQMIESVAKIQGYSWQRYSQEETLKSDLILVDCLGELVNLYAITDVVILGGAFEPIGGHNAAEAAQFGCKIISGPHYFNQKDIFEAIEGIAVVEPSALSRRIQQYALLKPTKIKVKSDITPILESIHDVL